MRKDWLFCGLVTRRPQNRFRTRLIDQQLASLNRLLKANECQPSLLKVSQSETDSLPSTWLWVSQSATVSAERPHFCRSCEQELCLWKSSRSWTPCFRNPLYNISRSLCLERMCRLTHILPYYRTQCLQLCFFISGVECWSHHPLTSPVMKTETSLCISNKGRIIQGIAYTGWEGLWKQKRDGKVGQRLVTLDEVNLLNYW